MSFKICAEIAKNHSGSMSSAYALINDAIASGADCIKLQALSLTDINPKHPNASRYKESYLSLDQIKELKNYCELKHINCYASAFSLELLPYLSKFNNIIKIPSQLLSNKTFVKLAIELFHEIHISTGMHSQKDIITYLDEYMEFSQKKNKILAPYHCVSMYPTPPEYARLDRLTWLRNRYGIVGYSDHTIGNAACNIAVTHKVSIIEKHFASNTTVQQWCWNELELKRFVMESRNALAMMKDSPITQTEIQNYMYYCDEYLSMKKGLKVV